MTAQPPGLMVAGTAVIIQGSMLKHTLLGVQLIIQRRRRERLPVPREWQSLEAALTCAMSACPPTDVPDKAIPQDSRQMVGTREAATMLDVTERHARRLCERLGGYRDADGRCWFDRAAILEHLEGKEI